MAGPYYINFVDGLDANNGLGPDASHATNKPWKTIAKALGASGMASGEIAYLAPVSFREVVTAAMTSATAETQILGDPSNAQGFKTSAGVLLPPGDVIWTAYTTDDVSAPSTTSLLTLASRDFLTFANIVMIGGNTDPSIVNAATGTTSTNITLRDCVLIPCSLTGRTVRIETAAGVPAAWTIDRCTFLGVASTTGLMTAILNRHSADYDANVQVTNCLFISPASNSGGLVRVSSTGSGAGFGGGVDVIGCTALGGTLLLTADANLATSIPCTAIGNVIYSAGVTALSANTAGQITEDYNLIWATTRDTNVTDGSNSISSVAGPARAPLFEIGQSRLSGRATRPFMMPCVGSGLLNFGVVGNPSVDILNRPRPAGSGLAATSGIGVAVGAFERHDTATEGAAASSDGGSGGHIVLTGPGDHDFKFPVDASLSTISVKVTWDANHGNTTKPQMILLANAKIGVSTETITAAGTAGSAYETLTTSPFTPTAKGVVTVRLVARSAAGNGICRFDSMS